MVSFTEIDSGSLIPHSTLLIRDLIASGTTDPISATRSANSKFVMTSYPDRPVEYPIITVKGRKAGGTRRMGSQSEGLWTPMAFEVRVWARNVKERDELASRWFESLRTSQKGTTPVSGTEAYCLFDLEQLSGDIDIDEEGVDGIHSKVTEVGYNFFSV